MHVDLFLQPSWTWNDINRRHFNENAIRALENGFTMFRCSSDGESGANIILVLTSYRYIFISKRCRRCESLWNSNATAIYRSRPIPSVRVSSSYSVPSFNHVFSHWLCFRVHCSCFCNFFHYLSIFYRVFSVSS